MLKVSLVGAIVWTMVAPPSVDAQTPYTTQKVVSIGDRKSDDIGLTEIAAIVVDKNHNAYVAQGSQVWKFDKNGKLLAKLGRKGAGPGEYSNIFSMGIIGDSLWISDPSQARVTLLAKDKAVASFRMDYGAKQSPPLAVLPNRAVLTRTYTLSPNGDLLGGMLSLRGSDGREQPLQPLFLKNNNVTLRLGDAMMNFDHPFNDADLTASAPSGAVTYVVSRAIPQSAADAMYGIASYGAGGRRLQTVRKNYGPRVLKKADYEKVMADYMTALNNTQLFKTHPKDAPAAFRAAVPQPKFLPPWKNAIVSSDGALWLQPWLPATTALNESVSWFITDASGRVSSLVSIPRRFRLQAVAGNDLWGYEVGEDDEIVLVKYVLRKS